MYCDGFAESIARQQPSKHVLTHAPRNNRVEVFSFCPTTDRCFATRAHCDVTTVCSDHVTYVFCYAL
jgi:hypothetical protein